MMPYIIYIVVWTAALVTVALTGVVAFVPAVPLEIMIAMSVMFLFFAAIITASKWLYVMLQGKTPAAGQNAPKPDVLKTPPKVLPPNQTSIL